MNWLRRLYLLWKFDKAMNRLFHAWLYLFVNRLNGVNDNDTGRYLAFDIIDNLLVDMIERRKSL
jgi:hypothetical protein